MGKQSRADRPYLAITMGDPAGIGPEIVLKALADPAIRTLCRPVIFGDAAWMQQTAHRLNLPLAIQMEADDTSDVVLLRQATKADLSSVRPGQLAAAAGQAAAECVFAAAKATMQQEMDAIVTAPINKEAIALGGFPYPGHTELLAHITGTEHYGMLLLSGPLRVLHVSTHVSLREAIARVISERVLECFRLGHRACRELGIAAPRIAAAGLNPHAGESGLFGREEKEQIAPAVVRAQREGIAASGPWPPDTVFARALQGEFDLVLAMYHDQGHIPVKLHGFDSGVNVTVGLPITRVSVDHGTAFDIAGQGVARAHSMLEAIHIAVQMVRSKNRLPVSLPEEKCNAD